MSSHTGTADHQPEANGAGPSRRADLRGVLDEAETVFAHAMEKVVAGASFAELLGYAAENMMAVNRIARDSADLMVANLRLAGRRDVVRLERQLGRTEDKLETVLQELEGLRAELANGSRRV